MSIKKNNQACVSDEASNHPFDTDAPSLSRRAIDRIEVLSGNYWGELRSFLTLAKTGSFTQAGAALGVSHATVAREVKRLQDTMRCQLAVAGHNGVFLTDKGRKLAAHLLNLDQTLYFLQSDLRGGDAQGVVRMGITDGLGVVFVVPELARFSLEYPHIQVHLKSPGNLKNLRENQTDVILGFHPDDSSDMLVKPLGWLHFLPIASESYIDRHGVPSWENVGRQLFVQSEMFTAKGPWDAWQALISKGTIAHYCDASISYGMMIKAGVGIGLLANYNMMEPAARSLYRDVHISLRLYAVARKDRLASKPVKIVFDLLERLFGPSNPWFANELSLSVNDPAHRAGYASLFNL